MKIGNTRARCAAGQFSTIVSGAGACVEPVLIGQGLYASAECRLYANEWAIYCVEDGSCNICICSCVPASTGCPVRAPVGSTTVCASCPAGHSGDGLTCTLCGAGTISTNPISGSCIACPAGHYRNGLICTLCPTGTDSTVPVLDSCVASAVTPSNQCSTTRSLTCSGPCACSPTTSENSRVITDGPGSYTNNMNCQYVFTSNAIVTLQFTSFATEANNDFVIIDICTTESCTTSTRLLRVSGTKSLSVFYSTNPSNPFLR